VRLPGRESNSIAVTISGTGMRTSSVIKPLPAPQVVHFFGDRCIVSLGRGPSPATVPWWNWAYMTRTSPEVFRRRPGARVIGLPSVHYCAALIGLGVRLRGSHADAAPRRAASSRRARRGCPVLPVRGAPTGRTDLLC
jgi:hypothetical protein